MFSAPRGRSQPSISGACRSPPALTLSSAAAPLPAPPPDLAVAGAASPQAVTLIFGEHGSERLIVLCSVILSFQLPFALVPLVKFCGEEKILGPLAVSRGQRRAMHVISGGVVLANVYLVARPGATKS